MASTITETCAPPPYSPPPSASSHPVRSHQPTNTNRRGAAVAPVNERGIYKTSIPLYRLTRYAAPVDCPVCGQRALTRVKYVIGEVTHILAFTLFCSTGALFWIPYALKAMKNVDHHCGNQECGVLLATWHRMPVWGCVRVSENL